MTEVNSQQPKSTKKAGGIGFSFSNWFNALRGKPVIKPVPEPVAETPQVEPAVSQTPSVKTEIAAGDDSVKADIEGLQSVVQKVSQTISEKTSPVLSKGKSGSEQALASAKKVVDLSFLTKLIKLFLVAVFLMLLVFIGLRLFRGMSIPIPGINNGNNGTVAPTPTFVPYQPYLESVYAKDPEILKIEETIKVLDRETANAFLKETTLNPPRLDFEVSF